MEFHVYVYILAFDNFRCAHPPVSVRGVHCAFVKSFLSVCVCNGTAERDDILTKGAMLILHAVGMCGCAVLQQCNTKHAHVGAKNQRLMTRTAKTNIRRIQSRQQQQQKNAHL